MNYDLEQDVTDFINESLRTPDFDTVFYEFLAERYPEISDDALDRMYDTGWTIIVGRMQALGAH